MAEIQPLDALRNEKLQDQFDANTDGELFLCFFKEQNSLRASSQSASSSCTAAVMKFRRRRLENQAELFANELASYLGIPTPMLKLIRKSVCVDRCPAERGMKTNEEWCALCDQLQTMHTECADRVLALLKESSCFLLMEFLHTVDKVQMSFTF